MDKYAQQQLPDAIAAANEAGVRASRTPRRARQISVAASKNTS